MTFAMLSSRRGPQERKSSDPNPAGNRGRRSDFNEEELILNKLRTPATDYLRPIEFVVSMAAHETAPCRRGGGDRQGMRVRWSGLTGILKDRAGQPCPEHLRQEALVFTDADSARPDCIRYYRLGQRLAGTPARRFSESGLPKSASTGGQELSVGGSFTCRFPGCGPEKGRLIHPHAPRDIYLAGAR
jgi:hypothetical protein